MFEAFGFLSTSHGSGLTANCPALFGQISRRFTSGSLRTMDELHRWLAAHREASLAFAPATGCPMEEGRLVSSRRPAQALIAPPGRGSLRRRTGSGAGRKNLRTAPTHERPGASAATKGTLGRAWRTLERANHALRAPDRGSDASPDSGADWRLSSKRSKLTFLSSKRTSEFTASLGLDWQVLAHADLLREGAVLRLYRLPDIGRVPIECLLAPPIGEHQLQRRRMGAQAEIVAPPLGRLLRVVLWKGEEVVAGGAPVGLDAAMPAGALADAEVAAKGPLPVTAGSPRRKRRPLAAGSCASARSSACRCGESSSLHVGVSDGRKIPSSPVRRGQATPSTRRETRPACRYRGETPPHRERPARRQRTPCRGSRGTRLPGARARLRLGPSRHQTALRFGISSSPCNRISAATRAPRACTPTFCICQKQSRVE